jgi:hypothetical protein
MDFHGYPMGFPNALFEGRRGKESGDFVNQRRGRISMGTGEVNIRFHADLLETTNSSYTYNSITYGYPREMS